MLLIFFVEKVESYGVHPSVDHIEEEDLEEFHDSLREEAGLPEAADDEEPNPDRIVTSESLEEITTTFCDPTPGRSDT